MSKDERYSIVPYFIKYDNRLDGNAKLLYSDIASLSKTEAGCYATNGYFAKLYGTSNSTIRRWISQLSECGYIKALYSRKPDGNTKRQMCALRPSPKTDAAPCPNMDMPPAQI